MSTLSQFFAMSSSGGASSSGGVAVYRSHPFLVPGTYTFTIPAGVTRIAAYVMGGGGGAGG